MRLPRTVLLLGCCLLLAPGRTAAACPDAEEILRRLGEIDLRQASRTARFDTPPPEELYAKAARHVGEPRSAKEQSRGFAVIVAELPVEQLWKAVNDEPHHGLQEDYLPVRHSEVIEGTPRGEKRLLFQYFRQMGIGRWWVSRVEMNRDLFEASAGRLWEVRWEDAMDEVDPSRPPMNRISSQMPGIRESRGAWLLVALGDGCTLVEHFSWSDPGGMAGVAQPLMLKRALRSTVTGLVRMAEQHVSEPHPDGPFLRPDGLPLP